MTKLYGSILLLFCCGQIAAQQAGKVIIKSPVTTNEVFVFFKSLEPAEHQKQQLLKPGADGACIIPFAGKVYVYICATGYKSITDTIKESSTYTYTLQPLRLSLNEYVVTTGQYDARPTGQSVFNTTVITRRQIEQHGDNNVRDALMNQINIRLSEDPILGSQIKLQGVSGQNVKILIDGVPVIGRNNGNLDLSQINLNNIERIEVTQGPMSVIYGTDALGGVINLITKKQFQHPVEAHVHLGVESIGKYDADADVLLHFKNNNLSFNGGRNFFSGYPSFSSTERAQLWKPREQLFGGLAFSHIYKKATFTFKSQYFNELIANLGVPTVTPFDAYALDAYYRTIRFDNSLSANFKLNNNGNLDILGSYNYYRNSTLSYRKNLVTLENQLRTADNQDTTTFDALLLRAVYSNNNPTHKVNYQAGIDIDAEAGYGSLINKGVQHINDYATFASVEWKPTAHTLIRPAIRVASNSEYGTTLRFIDNVKFTPVLPSLNIKQDLKSNLALRLGIARGYRAPSLKELDLNFVDVNHDIHGNSDLKAEKSAHTDLQLSWNKTLGGTYIKCEPMLFYNNIYNLITLVQTGSSSLSYKYGNVGRYITYGVTVPIYVAYRNFNINAGYSVTGLYDSLSTTFKSAQKYTYTQEVSATAGYAYIRYKMAFNIYYKYTGATPGYALDPNGKLMRTIINDYSILDACLTKYLYNKRLNITAGVKNIFNVNSVYSNAAVGPHSSGSSLMLSPGRSIFIDMHITLYKSH